MPYSLEYAESAADDLSRLHPAVARQVADKLSELAGRADDFPHHALTGRLRGQFRLRVGHYRVLYELDRGNRRITVRAIHYRSAAYKQN